MYDNIGSKIKGLAKALFIILAIATAITGLVLLADDPDDWFIGLPIMVGGPLVSWLSSWVLYGFGEIIDKLTSIDKKMNVKKENLEDELA